MPQHAHSIQLRQVQIEDDQVVIELAAHSPRLLTVLHHVDRVVFPYQPLAHKSGQSCIIFGYQDSHKSPLITA